MMVAEVDVVIQHDLVGYGDAGTRVLGDVTGDRMEDVVGVGYAQGWRNHLDPRALTDLNGDGLQDIVGLGYEGLYAAYGRTDNTFDAPFLMSGD
ncbi:hypothetical protein [Kocuria arenosa]|uniref:hypothetical protein n=1 Tax=Kocuria arenosa TaxID=3071446 RepID=UPI0034D66DEF